MSELAGFLLSMPSEELFAFDANSDFPLNMSVSQKNSAATLSYMMKPCKNLHLNIALRTAMECPCMWTASMLAYAYLPCSRLLFYNGTILHYNTQELIGCRPP
jgi:hypothetical protein